MPVRIYDISKKLGLENKDIISKAKALGITAAKVASSSLDKITAEFLEEEILKDHPDIASRLTELGRQTRQELGDDRTGDAGTQVRPLGEITTKN